MRVAATIRVAVAVTVAVAVAIVRLRVVVGTLIMIVVMVLLTTSRMGGLSISLIACHLTNSLLRTDARHGDASGVQDMVAGQNS